MYPKSYFAASVPDFLARPMDNILGDLAKRVGLEHSGNKAKQIHAWRVQINLLKAA